jgi:DNA-binding NarL/FixJ family response regulator
MTPIKILLCDDDAEKRQYLQILLEGFGVFTVVGSFGCGEAAAGQATSLRPEVVLMAIDLPDISGIECTRRIKKALPDAHVIMYTVYEDDDILFEALRAGASGYLLKETPPHRLAEALHEVITGGGPLSPGMACKLIRHFHQNPGKPAYPLTSREMEVLGYLVQGLSIRGISEKIFLTEDGVKKNLKNIYHKLKVRTGKQAIIKAVRERILESTTL